MHTKRFSAWGSHVTWDSLLLISFTDHEPTHLFMFRLNLVFMNEMYCPRAHTHLFNQAYSWDVDMLVRNRHGKLMPSHGSYDEVQQSSVPSSSSLLGFWVNHDPGRITRMERDSPLEILIRHEILFYRPHSNIYSPRAWPMAWPH